MATRLLAGVILLTGVVLLGVVTLGGGGENQGDVVSASGKSEPVTTARTEDAVSSAADTAVPMLEDVPDNFGPRKNLVDLDGWLNTDIDDLSDLDGRVIVVEMWTFGCRNCKARIPHNQELYASHSRSDFEIVGVHAPEFDFEADISNIEQAVVDLGVTWPVALDTNKVNFRAWQDGGRRFWPRTYVIDQNGDVRFDHIGEGKYDELSQTVDWLIANPPT
jgi:thiol-disulfide isomerase/thioredoxin